ncbi:hypothetical protein AXW67_25875 [Bradyrhizobium neotropicale]|uniref:Uncharacterized protein n=1 Tax=Bradyrhizobium neotropicale TaxID=1497615 RepID=A0A176YRT6_9BRAD|nr:hypothetical protein AXW67_25875 [Bradyrhizobium neotropicale]
MLLLHLRHRRRDAVESGRQVDVQDCMPLGGRKFLHRRGELDAGIVYEDIERPNGLHRRAGQPAHGICLRHVGAIVNDAYAMVAFDALAD